MEKDHQRNLIAGKVKFGLQMISKSKSKDEKLKEELSSNLEKIFNNSKFPREPLDEIKLLNSLELCLSEITTGKGYKNPFKPDDYGVKQHSDNFKNTFGRGIEYRELTEGPSLFNECFNLFISLLNDIMRSYLDMQEIGQAFPEEPICKMIKDILFKRFHYIFDEFDKLKLSSFSRSEIQERDVPNVIHTVESRKKIN